MTLTLDVHPLKSRVGDFIAGLKTMEKEPITSARVVEYVAQMRPLPEALAPYLLWNGERYTRNLIYRDDLFEVLALCWLPGQKTPIHSHNGQLGWVTVVQGELVCRNYRFVRSQMLNSQASKKINVPGAVRSATARPVEVELLESATCQADGTVSAVDRRQTTHRIENLEKSLTGSVSLHVYSRPIDSCVLFDEATRCCERRPLQYHSADGIILASNPAGRQVTETAA